MDKKVILFFFVGLMLSAAAAEPVLVLNYAVCKNDSVSINSIKYADGVAKVYQSASDEYALKITAENGNALASLYLPVSFYLLSEPPREVNCSMGYQRLPWESDAKYLEFYHGDKIMSKIDISRYICKPNALCEPNSGENNANCQQDCPIEKTGPKTETLKSSYNSTLLFAGVLAVAIIVGLLYVRRKIKT